MKYSCISSNIGSNYNRKIRSNKFGFFLVLFFFNILSVVAYSQSDSIISREENKFIDHDHLGKEVYIGKVTPFTLPSDNTYLKLKSAKLKSSGITLKSATTEDLEWPAPGSIHIDKSAEATSTDGRWKINISVEGKNIPMTSDVVLVIDDSGSMGTTKMNAAKDAANDFVDELLTNSTGIRIAVVTINSPGNSGSPQVDQGFTENISDLHNAIDAISSGGGTNLQGGLYAARQLVNSSTADKKSVILLSDGVPTYSYNSQVTTDFTVACGSINYFNISRDDFEASHLFVTSSNYSDVVGSGSSFDYTFYQTTIHCGYWDRTFRAGNHGISTKYEAGLIMATGTDVYTIGFEVAAGGDEEDVLTGSQNSGYYPANSSNIGNIYSEIGSNIAYAATNAVFTDPMSTYIVMESEINPTYSVYPNTTGDIVVTKGTVTFIQNGYVLNDPDDPDSGDSDIINWEIIWNIGTVSESGDRMYYFLNMAPKTDPTILYPANENTYMDYIDVNNNPAHQSSDDFDFTIPLVSGGKGSIEIIYYRVNGNGDPVIAPVLSCHLPMRKG